MLHNKPFNRRPVNGGAENIIKKLNTL
jgi:hypothetical protein